MVYVKMDIEYHFNYYDWQAGWENTNIGWYEVTVKDAGTSTKKHEDCVMWLYNNIDKPERHARWVSFFGKSHFRFRYERDYIWFRLTWE